MTLTSYSSITLSWLLPEKSVLPIVIYEFSESFLDDPDSTFLYYTTVSLQYIQRRIVTVNPEAIGWIHAGNLSEQREKTCLISEFVTLL